MLRKRPGAFSLLEIMIVVIILGIIAKFVVPNLIGKSDEAKSKLTCIQINSISQSLKMFKSQKNKYPTNDEGLGLLVTEKFFDDGRIPQDSWGNDFIYTIKDNKFDISSFGQDGIEDTEDDLNIDKCNK